MYRTAVGVLTAIATLSVTGLTLAATGAPSSEPSRELSIPSQPLAQALASLARQIDIQFVYLGDAPLTQISVPLNGRYAAGPALDRLLEGTGLEYEFVDENTVTIRLIGSGAKQKSEVGLTRMAQLTGSNDASMLQVAQAPASSQQASPQTASAPVSIEEITVTARAREERLQDIPLAIAVFTAEDIEDAGFQDLGDLAKNTAGMEFNPRGSGRPGRVDSVIRLRGVSESPFDHLQPASLFIDGNYVLGTAATIGLQDIERVEVIKGPQSAFFGRNTFAGAVNYITRTPSLTGYSTQISASAATYDKYDMSILTSGPLVSGKVAYQLNGRLYHRGAEWRATDGDGLGEESSKFVSGVLYAEPADQLSIKFRAYFQKDDDGQPISGQIRGRFFDSCTGKTVQRLDANGNPATFSPRQYICGRLPEFGTNEPNLTILSRETNIRPAILFQNRTGGPQPDLLIRSLLGNAGDAYLGKNVPDLDRFGMVRNQIRLALNVDYNFGDGYSANLLAGWNDTRLNLAQDYDFTDESYWFSMDPKYARDKSIEARINSPQDQRLRWLIGGTYYDQTFITNSAGGQAIAMCFNTCAVGPVFAGVPPTNGNIAKVWGAYGSVSYDFGKFTLDLETRYLRDRRSVIISGSNFTTTFNQFTPRIILTYKPTDKTTFYAQASRGVLPGTTNGIVATCSPDTFLTPYISALTGQPSTASECAQLESQVGPDQFKKATTSQMLDALEVGWKQALFEDKVRFNMTAWHYTWKNRPFSLTVNYFRDDVNPANRDRRPAAVPTTLGIFVPGSQKLWGVEFESFAAITPNLEANLNVSWSDNKFVKLDNRSLIALVGFTNLKGLEIDRNPHWQGNLALTYTDTLNDTWDWYSRVDVSYYGATWADIHNLAQTDPYSLTHLRLGVKRDDLRVEFFVRNLFQERDWANASRRADFSQPTFNFTAFQSVTVIPQEKRTFGIRTNVSF
jgi:iron complex outermembrane receptor protein